MAAMLPMDTRNSGLHPQNAVFSLCAVAYVSNEELRERYPVTSLFREGEIVLSYSRDERFVIGGAVLEGGALDLPD